MTSQNCFSGRVPTGSRHDQTLEAEQQQAREQRRKTRVQRALCDWLPTLNYRADLNLRSSAVVSVPNPTKTRLLRCPGVPVESRLIRSDGTIADSIRTDVVSVQYRTVESRIETIPGVRAISDGAVYQTAVNFMLRLNRRLARDHCRHGHRRRLKLDAIAYYERGAIGDHPHLHFLLERPWFVDEKTFRPLVEDAWAAQPFAWGWNNIEPTRTLEGSIAYNGKGNERVYIHQTPDADAPWRTAGPLSADACPAQV